MMSLKVLPWRMLTLRMASGASGLICPMVLSGVDFRGHRGNSYRCLMCLVYTVSIPLSSDKSGNFDVALIAISV